MHINLGVDAMNLVSAIQAAQLRTPSERTMLVQLLWLKELLFKHLLSLTWYDTRDMSADAHTKGCIARTALLELAAGTYRQQHMAQAVRQVTAPSSRRPLSTGEEAMAGRGVTTTAGDAGDGPQPLEEIIDIDPEVTQNPVNM